MRRTVRLLTAALAFLLLAACLQVAATNKNAPGVNVSIMVIGDDAHGASPHSEYQTWIDKTGYIMPEGSTAEDLIAKALDAHGLSYSGTGIWGPGYIASVTAPEIWGGHTLSEPPFNSNGPYAGWSFTSKLPGEEHVMSDKGISEHILTDGEFILLRYADDYRDIYDESFNFIMPLWWLNE